LVGVKALADQEEQCSIPDPAAAKGRIMNGKIMKMQFHYYTLHYSTFSAVALRHLEDIVQERSARRRGAKRQRISRPIRQESRVERDRQPKAARREAKRINGDRRMVCNNNKYHSLLCPHSPSCQAFAMKVPKAVDVQALAASGRVGHMTQEPKG